MAALDPVVEYGIARTQELFADLRVLAITGAGVSTDSGIPDYRGQGRVVRHPLTFDQFMASKDNRSKYWARSYVGWNRVAAAKPNQSHLALAAAERLGILGEIITQNVDGLHQKAGSERVLELHGRLDQVICTACSAFVTRAQMDSMISALNVGLIQDTDIEFTPDGDAEIEVPADFQVPTCIACGGDYKPDVVFFGEQIPLARVSQAKLAVEDAQALLVAGSSLAVNSGLRLVKQAKTLGHKIVIINRGETKADDIADLKLNASTSEVLGALYL